MADSNTLPTLVIKYLCAHCDKSEHLDKMISELKTVFNMDDETVTSTLQEYENLKLEDVFDKGFPLASAEMSKKAENKPKEEEKTEGKVLKSEDLVPVETVFAKEIENKFCDYEKNLCKKNYYNGLEEGSAEYKAKRIQARKFYFKNISNTPTKPELKASAEEFKAQGNSCFSNAEYEKAQEFYTKAIGCDYKNAIYFANRGTALSNLNKDKEALVDYLTAVILDPNYVKAIVKLGQCYAKLGNNDSAKKAFTVALSLDPTNQIALDSLKALPTSSAPHIDFNEVLNDPNTQNTLHNVFGANADGIANALNQPGMQNMIESAMNNPAIMNMAANMASSLFGGQAQGANGGNPQANPDCNQQ